VPPPTVIVQQIFNGLTLGSLYGLVAAGLALIFGVMQLANFAHGEFFMLGAFVFYLLYAALHVPYFLAVALAMLGMGVFGAAFHRAVLVPIINRGWHVHLVATLAASIVFTNAAIQVFGTTPKDAPTDYSRAVVVLGILRFTQQRAIVLVVALVVLVGLHLFIQRTRWGKAMRALSQNREACQVVGIKVAQVSLLAFGIGTGLAGLAAGLVSPLYNIYPGMGTLLTLKAFAVVIMGGFGNVNGAIYAAFLLGLVESFAAGYLSSAYTDAIAFAAMILVLLVRPHGLFGRHVGI
jgi:branched-chain amino acid transport system permease protein